MEKSVYLRQEGNASLIELRDQSLLDAEFNFPLGLGLMLENIRKEWAGSGKLPELLDYVYATAPMVEAKRKFESSEKVHLDLSLEREKMLEELGV